MFGEKEIIELVEKANSQAFEFLNLKKFDVCEIILQQALKVMPNNQKSLHLYGLLKHYQERYEEAIDLFLKASKDSKDTEILNNLALSYSACGEYKKAINALENAIQLDQTNIFYLGNLALQYRLDGQIKKAIELFEFANSIKPTVINLNMLGCCYAEEKDYDKAENSIKQALKIDPEFSAAHLDLAIVYQNMGRMDEAWHHYEYRKNVYDQLQIFKKIYEPEKSWDGSICPNIKLLIHAEQGFGDTIQFARYLKILKQSGIYIIFHCDQSLKDIFSTLADEFYFHNPAEMLDYDKREDFILPSYDYHCSLLSIPFLLKNPEIVMPPYIFCQNPMNLDKFENKIKIGIVWAGNPMHPNDQIRSCYLKYFKPIQDLPNIQFFSLVKDIRVRKYKGKKEFIDYTEDTNEMNIIDLSPHLNDFMSTANIIDSLDLVISVDSCVLHLAGAMNKKAFAMIPYDHDWRWQDDCSESIWYPSIKLFRQKKRGDWEQVINDIVEELKK